MAVQIKGVDFSWGAPTPDALKQDGYRFAVGYLSHDPTKNWTAGRVQAFHAAGILTVSVWESTGSRALDGHAAGVQDAKDARLQGAALGMGDRPIYFAVDFDTSLNRPAIVPYFEGLVSELGLARVGVYGGLSTVQTILNAKLAAYAWQAYAWSGGVWDARADLRQIQNGIKVGGVDCDLDIAMSDDYGQWPHTHVTLPVPRGYAKVEIAHDLHTGGWSHKPLKGVVTWAPGEKWDSAELQVCVGGARRGQWRVKPMAKNAPPLGD